MIVLDFNGILCFLLAMNLFLSVCWKKCTFSFFTKKTTKIGTVLKKDQGIPQILNGVKFKNWKLFFNLKISLFFFLDLKKTHITFIWIFFFLQIFSFFKTSSIGLNIDVCFVHSLFLIFSTKFFCSQTVCAKITSKEFRFFSFFYFNLIVRRNQLIDP